MDKKAEIEEAVRKFREQGIKLNFEEQHLLLSELAEFYAELPFIAAEGGPRRYDPDNLYYPPGDAFFLYAMIRKFQPRRVIEIGCGMSSAAVLDTNERFMSGSMECTFIDPFPDKLMSALRSGDEKNIKIITDPAENIPLSFFKNLEAGDFLLIDTMHEVKKGSYVNKIFHEILPALNPGVVIHIHDIFWPFEYPETWFPAKARYNEIYMARCFLQYNPAFQVLLLTSLMTECHKEFFVRKLPFCLKNPGAALWLKKVL